MNINQIFRKIIFAVVVSCIYAFSLSAQINVTGVVTDNTGSPVPGVNVIVKGTTTGVVTEGNGRYAITVPSGDVVLIFSFVGFATQEIAVSNRSSIDVFMAEDSQEIDEVVVVGYGTQRKSDVTGSISVVNSENLTRSSSFSALDGLKGMASGVNVFLNSGEPGGAMRVVIRGQSSINAYAEPLYVVDGVPTTDFQFLNPYDIERMEVLKDASSTAIYGARGAQGVILVTTKRGLQEERTSVSYNGYVSLSTLPSRMDVMNSADFMKAYKMGMQNAVKYGPWSEQAMTERWTNIAQNSAMNDDFVELFRINGTFNPQGWQDLDDNSLEPIYDTDWQNEMTRNAVSHSHQLSIQHGSKKSSTGAFLNYTDNQGILLNNYTKRISARLTHDAKPLSWLSTSMNLTVNHVWRRAVRTASGGWDALRSNLEMAPIFPVVYPDGTMSNSQTRVSGFGFEATANPVDYLNRHEDKRNTTMMFGNAGLTFHLAEGLELKTQFGMNARIYRRSEHAAIGLLDQDAGGRGEVNIDMNDRIYWQEETYLTYTKVLDQHRFSAMVGLSWTENIEKTWGNRIQNFNTNVFGVHNIGAGTEYSNMSTGWNRWAMNSYFTRLTYSLSDKYSATFTARADGSSRFGANNKYAFFPSGGLAWNMSEEDFMQDVSWIDRVKLHTSYGMTGNSELSLYQSLALFSPGTVLLNGTRVSTANSTRMANPDLRWEKTTMFDIGFDVSMLDNRLNFDVSWYHKYTDDLLLAAPLPISSGYQTIMRNIGAMSNRGWDIMITGMPVVTSDFTWTASLNANYNTNKIERLGVNNEDILVGDTWLNGPHTIMRVGESFASIYTLKRLGIRDEAYVAENGGRVGTAIRSTQKEIVGKGMPDWTGSFINRFQYKNFDLTAELQFVVGGNIRFDCNHTIEDRFGYGNVLRDVMTQSWKEGMSTGPDQIQAIRIASFDGQDTQMDSRFVKSASYLRGRLFELGYTFNPQNIGAINMSSLRAYISVNNLFVAHDPDFKGYDPEVSTRGHFEQGAMNYQYPVPRVFTLGVNVTF